MDYYSMPTSSTRVFFDFTGIIPVPEKFIQNLSRNRNWNKGKIFDEIGSLKYKEKAKKTP